MFRKPTYEELKQRVRELEKIALEHKRTAEALKESEERYRQIFNIAPAGIYEVDYRTGKLVKANDAVCEYTGYTHDELLSMNGIDLLTKKSQEKFLNRIDNENNLLQQVEYNFKRNICILSFYSIGNYKLS